MVRTSVLESYFSHEQLHIVLDPVVDLAHDRRPHGHEALMRGPRGMPFEGPMLAFALAKSLDALEELDLRCLEAAIATAPPEPRLFLNVHPTTLSGSGLGRIHDLVQAAGRPPSSVVLEVLEHLSGGESALARAVRRARRQGFAIAIDDFGQGASNLDRLLRLEPDYLKIDRHFLIGAEHDRQRRVILGALARLGTGLGIEVIAEGLENGDQAAILHDCGIHLAQGRWLRPSPATRSPRDAHRIEPFPTDASDPSLLTTIDGLDEAELDRLPFGVIQLAADGTILQYNRYEESLSSYHAHRVVGRDFFTEVAPCTDVREFAGRFREGVARGELHTTFDFDFAFAPPKRVRVTLFLSTSSNTAWVFVEG